jgi:putative ABC transport system ATP-binding protein
MFESWTLEKEKKIDRQDAYPFGIDRLVYQSVSKTQGSRRMIKAVNLDKVYRSFNVETQALRQVNLDIREGEFVTIMGPSGCGKSTLLNLLALLDHSTSGEIYLMEQEVSRLSDQKRAFLRRNYLGFVFQNFNLIDELNVFENIELPLIYQGISKKERIEKVRKIMDELGIAHKSNFFPPQLSGGQQQRTAIARAVITKPLLLLADEPTGNLDSASGQEIMEMMARLNEGGTTIIMVTHSEMCAEYSQRSIYLFDGQVVTENINQLSE